MANRRWTVLLVLLTFCGCHRGGDGRAPSSAEDRLVKIALAYNNATNHLKRPPKEFSEIQPYFEKGGAEDVIRSPNDGEEFIVLWGVDYNKLPPRREDPFTVAAYEKTGAGGKRYVLRMPMQVVLMSDAAFAKAIFPPGYQPPN